MAENNYFGVTPSNTRDVESRYRYIATASQTTFAAIYAVGYVDVYYNGSHLDPAVGFTATDGVTVVLANPATAGASVVIVCRRQVQISKYADVLVQTSSQIATAGQTSFPLTYTAGSVFQVTRNGTRVAYTASSGSAVVLTVAASSGDLVEILYATAFAVANAVAKSGDTMTGALTLNAGGFSTTATAGDNSTKIATTAFVSTAAAAKLSLSGGTMTGAVALFGGDTGTTAALLDNSTKLATTAYVDRADTYGPALQGAFKNLALSANGTTAVVNVSADAIIVKNSSNQYVTLLSVSQTASTGAASGVAGSLDTGTWAFSTWYYIYVIYNSTSTTTSLLFSLSATSPTLPTGYTYFARVGALRTQSATNFFALAFKQYGRRVQWTPTSGSNLTAPPAIGSGSSGNPTTPTWTAVSWATIAPPTAASVKLYLYNPTTGTEAQAAPNNNYGAYTSTTNPPPLAVGNATSATLYISSIADLVPESSNFYYASNATGAALFGLGWEDNL